MAKYDTYELVYRTKIGEGQVEAKLSVLFENGDNVDNVMNEARDRLQTRVLNFIAISKLK